jgi:protein tyrosine phosphatase (PTP) superfamily phosphohydrolase (DUF442 family)
MRAARQYDGRITIGSVPSMEDVEQLRDLGYRTVVDLRCEEERFGEAVRRKVEQTGLRYVSIPISRNHIPIEALLVFYLVLLEPKSAPYYVFSKRGLKPLGFLLLMDSVLKNQTADKLFRRASEFGIQLKDDRQLSEFILHAMDDERFHDVVEDFRESWPRRHTL